jgi:uncharacterized oligopeptide transporter (OPT) family protein
MGLSEPKTVKHRRGLIQVVGTILMIGLIGLGSPVGAAIGVYILSGMIAGLDILLFVAGRFFPVAVLWAYRVEEWLGPLPWKRND